MFFYKCRFGFYSKHEGGNQLYYIDCIAAKIELTEMWHDRREPNYLIYNKTESCVGLILAGCMKEYLNHFCEARKF